MSNNLPEPVLNIRTAEMLEARVIAKDRLTLLEMLEFADMIRKANERRMVPSVVLRLVPKSQQMSIPASTAAE